jgi:hypothetical protein
VSVSRIIADTQVAPPAMSTSRAKLWIRTGILMVFGMLFSVSLAQDMTLGTFHGSWALMAFMPCLAIGYWMRQFVPMQVHVNWRYVTLSFDRIYFALILILVIAKAVMGKMPGMIVWADVLMCVILGLMMGRLTGICLRVRDLRLQHNLR